MTSFDLNITLGAGAVGINSSIVLSAIPSALFSIDSAGIPVPVSMFNVEPAPQASICVLADLKLPVKSATGERQRQQCLA